LIFLISIADSIDDVKEKLKPSPKTSEETGQENVSRTTANIDEAPVTRVRRTELKDFHEVTSGFCKIMMLDSFVNEFS